MGFKIQLYKSDYVISNQEEIYQESLLVADKVSRLYDGVTADDRKGVYKKIPESINVTWLYPIYNLFAAAAPSIHFYEINGFVNQSIRQYLFDIVGYPKDTKIWCQTWINCHNQDSLLNKHTHHFPHHGYLSIQPRDTQTMFYDGDEVAYCIKNEPGILYIGPGNIYHEVQALGPIQDYRVTIGFNFITNHDSYDKIDGASFIPIL